MRIHNNKANIYHLINRLSKWNPTNP